MKKILQSSIPLGDAVVYWSVFLIFFSILILFFTGCVTEKKARYYAMDHPSKFADFCAQNYPAQVIAPPVFPVRAHNENYQSALDSFFVGSKWLSLRLSTDSLRADSISRECSAILTGYARQVDSLTARIKGIAKNYKPCVPDTIGIPYTVLDSAKLTAERQKSSDLLNQIQILISDKDAKESSENRQMWYCYIFGVLTPFVLWGAFSILKRFL